MTTSSVFGESSELAVTVTNQEEDFTRTALRVRREFFYEHLSNTSRTLLCLESKTQVSPRQEQLPRNYFFVSWIFRFVLGYVVRDPPGKDSRITVYGVY